VARGSILTKALDSSDAVLEFDPREGAPRPSSMGGEGRIWDDDEADPRHFGGFAGFAGGRHPMEDFAGLGGGRGEFRRGMYPGGMEDMYPGMGGGAYYPESMFRGGGTENMFGGMADREDLEDYLYGGGGGGYFGGGGLFDGGADFSYNPLGGYSWY